MGACLMPRFHSVGRMSRGPCVGNAREDELCKLRRGTSHTSGWPSDSSCSPRSGEIPQPRTGDSPRRAARSCPGESARRTVPRARRSSSSSICPATPAPRYAGTTYIRLISAIPVPSSRSAPDPDRLLVRIRDQRSLSDLIASASRMSGRATPLWAPRSSTSSRIASASRSVAGSSAGTSLSSYPHRRS